MSYSNLLVTSLELTANKVENLTEPVYQRYFEASPESRDLMGHMDMLMCGRMLNEVITLLIMPDEDLKITLDFEVKTHAANGVNLEMYNHLFSALHYVVRDVSGDEWTPEFETAWQQRIDYLNKEIRIAAN